MYSLLFETFSLKRSAGSGETLSAETDELGRGLHSGEPDRHVFGDR
jgi:hypothetical protein